MKLTVTQHFLRRAYERIMPWWLDQDRERKVENFYPWLEAIFTDCFEQIKSQAGVLRGADIRIKKDHFLYVFDWQGKHTVALVTVKPTTRGKEKMLKKKKGAKRNVK